jgi:hypothetical protein
MMERGRGTSFLEVFAHAYQLEPRPVQVLHISGARRPEIISSLLESFPVVAELGEIDTRVVSYAARVESANTAGGIAAMDEEALSLDEQSHFHKGAAPPEEALWHLDSVVEMPPPAGSIFEAVAPKASPVGFDSTHVELCRPWPPKNQGNRETCVSFAVVALREQLLCQQQGMSHELSEQLLHWAIKTATGDPNTSIEPSHVKFGLDALMQAGTCSNVSCAYNPMPIVGNPSQANTPHAPTPAAIALALGYAHRPVQHEFTHQISKGKAKKVLSALSGGRAVAVTLPVFSDPITSTDNWSTRVGKLFGYVIDPPPGSAVSAGHAVCVTGFEPDSEEPTGGYFVIRNSWGRAWGSNLPIAGYVGPEPGYGQLSATYVDKYLWELGFL